MKGKGIHVNEAAQKKKLLRSRSCRRVVLNIELE